MKAEYRDAWVTALRSGEYKQGYEQLKSSCNEFCCLGVLADIAIKNNWFPELELKWNRTRLYSEDRLRSGGGTTFLLRSNMLDALKLDTDTQINLSNMNDQGSSFSAIATLASDNSTGVRRDQAGAKKFVRSRTRFHENAALKELIKFMDDDQ